MPVNTVAKRASTVRKKHKKSICCKPYEMILLLVLVRHDLDLCIEFQAQDMKKRMDGNDQSLNSIAVLID